MWFLLAIFFIRLFKNSDLKHKKKFTNKLIKNQHNRFPFQRLEDVYPLPGAGQNRPLPLLHHPYVQIEDDLLNGSPCPTWRSGKISSCGQTCHTQAYCVLMLLLGLNFLPQPLQANTLPLCCKILCCLGICKDLTVLCQTLQG